jgi:hypothetical protein
MTFQWSLVGLNDDGVNAVIGILQAGTDTGMNSFRFSVTDSALLLPNANFNVSVVVQNFMGASSVMNATVEIAGQPLPDVRVDSELTPRVFIRQSVTMKVRGSVSSCASSGDGRALQWVWILRGISAPANTVERGYVTRWNSGGPSAGFVPTGELQLSLAANLSEFMTSDPTTLRIPANVLQPGLEYLVEVVGRMAARPTVNVSLFGYLCAQKPMNRYPMLLLASSRCDLLTLWCLLVYERLPPPAELGCGARVNPTGGPAGSHQRRQPYVLAYALLGWWCVWVLAPCTYREPDATCLLSCVYFTEPCRPVHALRAVQVRWARPSRWC